MRYNRLSNGDDDSNWVFLCITGGIGFALLFRLLLPPTPLPPLDPREVIGCYEADGWPALFVGKRWFTLAQPGFVPRRYVYERGKDWNHLTLEPGLARASNRAGAFTIGNQSYVPRARRDAEGKIRWTTQQGPAEMLDVEGVVYERVGCPAGAALR